MQGDLAQFVRFVEEQDWTFAKTYAVVCPHEYVIRKQYPKQIFEWMVKTIRNLGFEAYFQGAVTTYMIAGDYYYWTMGAPIEKTIVINRARLSDYALIRRSWEYVGETLHED